LGATSLGAQAFEQLILDQCRLRFALKHHHAHRLVIVPAIATHLCDSFDNSFGFWAVDCPIV